MFKLVILSNNFDSIKNVCNFVINEIPDLQISGLATNQEEFLKLIDKVNPEVIMMSNSDFNKCSQKLDVHTLKLLFYNSDNVFKRTSNKLYIPENNFTNQVTRTIRKFISKQSPIFLRNKIIKILESFNFDFKLIGTTYLLESILYCYENKTDYVFENLEKNVYPEIANICSASVNNVKYSIVRTINIMNSNISPSLQKKLSENFKVDISEKTTAKQLISTIVTKL